MLNVLVVVNVVVINVCEKKKEEEEEKKNGFCDVILLCFTYFSTGTFVVIAVPADMFLSNLQRGGGPFEILDFFGQIFAYLSVCRRVQRSRSPRGSEVQIFHKRSKIVDLSLRRVVEKSRYFTNDPELWTFLYAAWLRGPDISQIIQKRLKKYPKKSIAALSHLAATWQLIALCATYQTLDLFG